MGNRLGLLAAMKDRNTMSRCVIEEVYREGQDKFMSS